MKHSDSFVQPYCKAQSQPPNLCLLEFLCILSFIRQIRDAILFSHNLFRKNTSVHCVWNPHTLQLGTGGIHTCNCALLSGKNLRQFVVMLEAGCTFAWENNLHSYVLIQGGAVSAGGQGTDWLPQCLGADHFNRSPVLAADHWKLWQTGCSTE